MAFPYTGEEMKDAERQANARIAARKAFLAHGKESVSIRRREVLGRDDLDERLDCAMRAYARVLSPLSS